MKNRKPLIRTTLWLGTAAILCGCGLASHKGTDRSSKQQTETVKDDASTTSYTLQTGELLTLSEEDPITSCQSSDDSILSATTDGTLHAKKAGTVQVTTGTGKDTMVYEVTVGKRGMVYPSVSMMEQEHLDLQFSNRRTPHVTWTSSDPSVAKVSKSGKVTAQSIGTATLTGTSKNHTYQCDLTVTKRIKSVIYLTFDDGPNSYTTPKILNILKKNHVKATFFELRPASYDYHLTKRVIDEGHTLALHGFQHKYDIIYKSEKVYHENLDKLRDLFFHKFGVWCTVSRFPGGSSNTVSRYTPGIMTKLTRDLESFGYHYFDWNVDSGDAGGARTASEEFRNVKRELVKGRANVVLMHDYADNNKTIRALDDIIRYGKKHGYTFLPITASTDQVHHEVNN